MTSVLFCYKFISCNHHTLQNELWAEDPKYGDTICIFSYDKQIFCRLKIFSVTSVNKNTMVPETNFTRCHYPWFTKRSSCCSCLFTGSQSVYNQHSCIWHLLSGNGSSWFHSLRILHYQLWICLCWQFTCSKCTCCVCIVLIDWRNGFIRDEHHAYCCPSKGIWEEDGTMDLLLCSIHTLPIICLHIRINCEWHDIFIQYCHVLSMDYIFGCKCVWLSLGIFSLPWTLWFDKARRFGTFKNGHYDIFECIYNSLHSRISTYNTS